MSKLSDILTDPVRGLLPYLEANLGNDYGRFQIRNYTFGSSLNTTGFRLRDRPSEIIKPSMLITQEALVGKMITVADQVQSQIIAADLARDIDYYIWKWSDCVCPWLSKPVTQFRGSLAISQDKGSTSWWVVAVREMEIVYSDRV